MLRRGARPLQLVAGKSVACRRTARCGAATPLTAHRPPPATRRFVTVEARRARAARRRPTPLHVVLLSYTRGGLVRPAREVVLKRAASS